MSLPFTVPAHWQIVPFGNLVADSAFGPRYSSEHYSLTGNIATLRIMDIEDDGVIHYPAMPLARLPEEKFSSHFLRLNDLVIARTGVTCGTTAVFSRWHLPVLPGAFLIRFRLTSNAAPKFYRYFFNLPIGRKYLLSVSSGACQTNLNITSVKTLPVPLPPLKEQQAIVEILSAYDDLIENNTRRIRILGQMAEMLYREWFVNFRFPGHETVRMVESELGQIPQGWSLRKLGEVLSLEYGKALKAEQRSGGVIPVFGSSGVVGYHSERLAHGPGIVVGRKGNVGSVFFCDCDFWVIDTAYYVSTSLPLHFVYFNLLTQNFLNNDAAVPGLNRNQAHSLPAVIPDANTLQTFESHVEYMFKLKTCLEKINSNLRTTRDLLLPKLVSGKISVEQIESEVAAQTV